MPVISFSKQVKRAGQVILLLAFGLIAAPATAQVVPDPDATEVAKTPLRDFNIDARDIPEVLRVAERDPYATAGLRRCDAMVNEIAALDQVLGADYDIALDDGKGGLNKGRIGQSVVGSIIPFRGVVREVTGAADAERALRAAYTAGMVRRAFLKGWGLGRGCDYPARPKAEIGAGE
ncbi:MAG: hypothetical protein CVT75_04650 [Alphaproteobacteria bacterium HGW-Alphaproteobacteria-14]|nr:MAG: hypothetical protein CVT75_04650 [Alphaproteobacteria bacterium HGW-Alphaproteobacteria-14]